MSGTARDEEPQPVGVPPSVLVLKENAMVMLLRNLDISRGLVNGTRYIVSTGGIPPRPFTRIDRVNGIVDGTIETIRVQRGSDRSFHEIPKVPFRFVDGQGVGHERLQFPLVVCYGMTYHRAQGLTLHNVVRHEEPPSSWYR